MRQGIKKLSAITAVAALLVGTLLALSPAGRTLNQLAYDANFALRGVQANSGNTIVVAIDEASFQELGMNWPWPRSTHATLLDSLFDAGAKAVVLDLILADRSSADEDKALAMSLVRNGPVVLATDEEQRATAEFTRIINVQPLAEFQTETTVLGSAALPVDADGFVRRFGGSNQRREVSLAQSAAQAFNPELKSLENPQILGINFTGPAGHLPQYSYYQALNAEQFLPRSALAGKLIFVGLVTQSEVLDQTSGRDSYPTPYTRWGAAYTNGVEIHAQAAQSILENSAIQMMSTGKAVLVGLLLAMITIWYLFRFSPLQTLLPMLLACLVVFAVSFWSFSSYQFYLPWPLLLMPSLIVGAVSPLVHYLTAWQERNFIHKAFSSYLAEPVVKQLMNQPELLKLGGSLQTGSVLFVDIQGFTSLSEKMPPQAVVELLNRYLGDLSEIAIDENGLVDKFIGDAMMVVWGAPLADPQHANHACQAALKMQEYLASARETDDRAENLYARIGIYSGEFVAGNVGGQRKFDYTVIGDTVNVAARLESANNELGTHILIGDATHNALDQDKFTCRRLDSIKIKGRLEQVVVYELESAKEPANV